MGAGGQLRHAETVGDVYRAPAAQPGHDELRDQRDGQVGVQGLGEQLADLGQVPDPAAAPMVVLAEPVGLDGHGDPLGGEPAQRRRRRVGTAGEAEPPAQRSAHRQRDDQRQRRVGGAIGGQGRLTCAVPAVEPDRGAGGADDLAQP